MADSHTPEKHNVGHRLTEGVHVAYIWLVALPYVYKACGGIYSFVRDTLSKLNIATFEQLDGWSLLVACVMSASSILAFILAAKAIIPMVASCYGYNERWKYGSIWINIKRWLLDSYQRRGFVDVYIYQHAMRLVVVSTAAAFEVISVLVTDQNAGVSKGLGALVLSAAHPTVVCLYLLLVVNPRSSSFSDLMTIRSRIVDSANEMTDERVVSQFWRAGVIDIVFIPLLAITATGNLQPFQLLYILPLMTMWIMTDEVRRHRVVAWIVIGVLGRALVESIVHTDVEPLSIVFGALPEVGLWTTIGIMLEVGAVVRQNGKEAAQRTDVLLLEQKRQSDALENANRNLAQLNDQLVRANESLKEAQFKALQELEKANLLTEAFDAILGEDEQRVFVKDRERRFVYCNDLLVSDLKRLPALSASPEETLDSIRARVIGKTDSEIGISPQIAECYERSDRQVLELTGSDPGHFADYETTFIDMEDKLTEGRTIWTTKTAICDKGGKPIGIAGSLVPGLPRQMRRFSQYLANRFPVFASMKDDEGHIVWANDAHLMMLKAKLVELVENDSSLATVPIGVRSGWSLPVILSHLRSGRGPKDTDLYPTNGSQYWRMDRIILDEAKQFAESGRVEEEDFHPIMEGIIKKHFSAQNSHRDEAFPKRGWMEYHVFPGETSGRWVEVWKMPWWEVRIDEHGNKRLKPKGILVFFEDRHKNYTRRSVILRWLQTRFANLPAKPRGELMLTFYMMISWFRFFVDGETSDAIVPIAEKCKVRSKGRLKSYPVSAADIRATLAALEQLFIQVKVNFKLIGGELTLFRHGEDLMCILVPIVINAIHAKRQLGECANRIDVVISKKSVDGVEMLEVSVYDNALLKPDVEDQINRLQKKNDETDSPGGGMFLAQNLFAYLKDLANRRSINGCHSCCDIAIRRTKDETGVVRWSLPLELFSKPQKPKRVF
jgi:hypothetical protein